MLPRCLPRLERPCPDAARCAVLEAAHDYWLEKRGSRIAPSRSDIRPEEMRKFLPYVMLLDVIGAPPRFRYRLVGTAFAAEYGQEITGRFVDEIDLSDQKECVLADYAEVVRSGAPSFRRWEYTKSDGRYVEVERVVLPLSGDGRAVNMLLGAITARGIGPLRQPPSDRELGLTGTETIL